MGPLRAVGGSGAGPAVLLAITGEAYGEAAWRLFVGVMALFGTPMIVIYGGLWLLGTASVLSQIFGLPDRVQAPGQRLGSGPLRDEGWAAGLGMFVFALVVPGFVIGFLKIGLSLTLVAGVLFVALRGVARVLERRRPAIPPVSVDPAGLGADGDAGGRVTVAPPGIPGFTFGAHLGSGGSACVFEAFRRSPEGPAVAVKAWWPGAVLIDANAARRVWLPTGGYPHTAPLDDHEREKLLRSEHAFLERVGAGLFPQGMELGEVPGGGVFFAMERLPGPSLRALLAGGSPGSAASVLRRLARLARDLAVLERRDASFFHGDLKPENIIVTPERGLRVVDPASRAESFSTTTEEYNPLLEPGREADSRALATMAIEALAGAQPFTRSAEAGRRRAPDDVASAVARLLGETGAPPEVMSPLCTWASGRPLGYEEASVVLEELAERVRDDA